MRSLPTAVVSLIIVSATVFAQDATSYAELPRFQRVNETLYRGAQPRDGGLIKLRELGINTIINLRGASARTRAQEAEARALGMNYFNIALPNWGRPEDARVQRILEIIAAPENGRVFVHCRTGVDRTGMIVALYRMTHEGWSTNDALADAERSGMHRLQFWMRDYTGDYGRHMSKTGPETTLAPARANEDFGDRVGAGMRFMEIQTFRARKVTSRFWRRLSGSLR